MAYWTIVEAAEAIRSGRLSAGELVEACLQQIERRDAELRAWVVVDQDQARRAAEQLDRLAAQGEPLLPLHGIPLGIKDIIDVAGLPTLAGSPLRQGHVAARDATVVARLREAGAVILGKTVTTEFASFDPPPTRNPWNPRRTPGGSSSGSAAAIATGMCLGAIGSQTGGSITRPATYCGVAGCKPTYGRVSLGGIVPLAFHLDHPGPMARCVADLALLLKVIARPDPEDRFSADQPTEDYRLAGPGGGNAPRLGVLVGKFIDEHADPAMRQAVDQALDKLRFNGAELEPVELRGLERALADHRRIMAVEAALYHRGNFPSRRGDYGSHLAALLDEGRATSGLDYAEALYRQRGFQRQVEAVVAEFDALVLPATTSTAPGPDTTGSPAFNSPWSYAGVPTVSFPCALASDGLPVGLQFVGRLFGEGHLLRTAAWCEATVGWRGVTD